MNPIREQISQMIQDVSDGNESACKAHAMLKELEQVIKSGLIVIQSDVLSEAREFNKEEIYYGGKWEIRSTPTYLDFSKDEVFINLNMSALDRKKELNQAWKASQTGKGFYDANTGEAVPVLPVKTPAKEICVFKLKS